MKLSVVTTLYKSSRYINEFYSRAVSAASQMAGDDFEIIFVNDGSPDCSLDVAVQLTKLDARVVVVDLSRNFGHHRAMMTGIAHARGDYVFLIDSDLEESPEWLIDFSRQMLSNSCDVVYGIQMRRKGQWFERWSGSVFWALINLLSGLSLPSNIVTARLMTRRYVDALVRHEEREVFMAGLWHITGFAQLGVGVTKLSSGDSTYTLRRKLALLVNSVTAFSSLPLAMIFYSGLFIFFIACCCAAYLIAEWFIFSQIMAGWTSVMVSVWLLGGLILSSLGVVGIYLSKVFIEIKRRPYTIVREIYGCSEK